MRLRTVTRTIKTACGKTVSFLQTEGQTNKMHSTEGPAIIYPESEKKSPEYYLYGIKYSKTDWKSLLAQSRATVTDTTGFDTQY